ncbi:ufm1-specific protease 1-like [Argiope bruennichi]|uniref:ufm1-specific protease 1-like n=1 Tax=Argiope bruennichi TaxID=94029 RepID=UPI002494ACC7|nr:ufm1-specific protease 1-like [Argiope bruennichi]
MEYKKNLLENVHFGLKLPANESQSSLIRGNYLYYHYKCDGFNDVGWGCGYRTLQTICSWVKNHFDIQDSKSAPEVPSIIELQKALVEIGDKNVSFIESREWIGSVEVSYCLDYFYKIPCRILHCRNIQELQKHGSDIFDHFIQHGSPVMMGGDRDCSSKGILGIAETNDGTFLLILDPHFSGPSATQEKLQKEGWIKWHKVNDLDSSSFYNLCFPLINI